MPSLSLCNCTSNCNFTPTNSNLNLQNSVSAMDDPSSSKLSQPLLHFKHRSLRALLFSFPTSLLALLLILLLAYNALSIFCLHLPFLSATPPPPQPTNLFPEKPAKLSSTVMYAVREENPPPILKTHFPLLHKSNFSALPVAESAVSTSSPRRRVSRTRRAQYRFLRPGARSRRFAGRVKEFFAESSCKVRFFMTWISSAGSFGDREFLAVESLFKSHPSGCLVIVSNSLDSTIGNQIFKPFGDKGFKILTVSPDFDYLFHNTHAQSWFDRLRNGNVDPGEVSLGQNLSNLLRLSLLYRFGGIYVDTDVLILKSFAKLRNTIGAQNFDLETGHWSRLNNAVLIFDKEHPLLYKFIQEFALTFNGNKWGHNGPYLVSRVVSRVHGRPGYDFTVLPPSAFYPVDWSRIRSFFQGPGDEVRSKWMRSKLVHIRRRSLAVHLWNRQSKKIKVEKGSIIDRLVSRCCVFCNNSSVSSS